MPRLGLTALRLTGGPGPGGRACRSPREPRVWRGSRVGIGFGAAPLGRPRAGGRVLRGESWPARGGGGRRAAYGHGRRTRMEAGIVRRRREANRGAASSPPAGGFSSSALICLDVRHWPSKNPRPRRRVRNPEERYANNPLRHRAVQDWLMLTPALPQPVPQGCVALKDTAPEKTPRISGLAAGRTNHSSPASPVPASGAPILGPLPKRRLSPCCALTTGWNLLAGSLRRAPAGPGGMGRG